MGSGEDWDGGGGEWRSPPADPAAGAARGWAPVEPAEREPDYPALFGELYRQRAEQDPLWETPPAAEPLPEPAQPDQPGHDWPFEETTQTWEPSDRSFEWPAEELPSTSTEWEPSPSWPDDPPAQPSTGPPPADWADAISTDVPAARRAQFPEAGPPPHAWRPEEAVGSEPAVPLGTAERPSATAPAAAESAVARRTQPAQGRRSRQPHDRPRSTWPRVVAVISWIVLVMVVCWFYVFPWLERILPENF
jgi:hypothetical protein